MKTSNFSLPSRLFLISSLVAGLLFNGPVAAAGPNSPAAPVPAGSHSAAANLLTIPAVANGVSSPKANGVCDKTEYADGLFVTFADGPDAKGTGEVYLIHDDNYLYMCITSPVGFYPARFDSLYLDPQGNGTTYTYAQQDDFSLRLNYTGGKSTFIGNGLIGGWQDVSNPDNGLWSGVASSDTSDVAEYEMPLANFNIHVCSTIFRLAGYHHHFAGSGNDYGWPSNQYYDQPGTWQPLVLGSANCGKTGSIAYVFRSNSNDATSFYSLLTTAGYSVSLVPLSDVASTDFSKFDLTIIANDTGTLNEWGTPPAGMVAAQVAKIIAPNKPILGLGEGGYAFFGQLSMFIGWPMGWHGPQNFLNRAAGFPAAIFSGVGLDPVQSYSDPTNSVGIYIKPSYPPDVTPVAMEEPPLDHSSIIKQGCRMLWGNSGSPAGMTAPDGTKLFVNTVGYTLGLTCPAVPPPPSDCGYTLEKTAVPDPSSLVTPGATILYTLTYQLLSLTSCPTSGKLVDVVPAGTMYVPGSASDEISPGADGVLTWAVTASPSPLTKTFKVQVMDTACAENKVISNIAELRPSAAAPLNSNTTTHTVNCPSIGLPNTQPMFAEEELKVTPYPLVAGTLTHLSVRVQNLGSSPVPVTVQFQVAPAATPLGTGLDYTTVASSSATLPGSGIAVLAATYVPDTSGNRCIQALVSAPGMLKPLATQSCLDLTEDFQPGQQDQLTIVVRNNGSSPAAFDLVVDNTCPGWTASVAPVTTASLMAGASQEVILSVTPPDPLTLGTGCHIDVQAWNGETLVGGVRKLDLPPVHLPSNVTPPWEEPEISFNPDPPVAGVSGQICIQLQNPLSVTKTVTVNFSVADFGAGIGFTPAAALTDISLPRNSLNTYCANWTPSSTGTLHRCVLATLVQAGALDQTSQHNIDILHPGSSNLGSLTIPFVAGNPGLTTRALSFDPTLVGIDPQWSVTFTTPGGGPPPTSLAGGGQVALVMHFSLGASVLSVQAPQPPANYAFGSRSLVEVSELLDGIPESGFTISLERSILYLPLIRK